MWLLLLGRSVFCVRGWNMCRHLYSIYRNDSAENSIERFHSRGQHLKVFTLEKSSTPTGLVWDTNMADVTSCELYSYFCNNFIVRSNVDFFTRWLSQSIARVTIECFHMTSRPPSWCPKTMKRRPCWCPKPVLWELNSFLMQTLSFVPINLHRC